MTELCLRVVIKALPPIIMLLLGLHVFQFDMALVEQ